MQQQEYEIIEHRKLKHLHVFVIHIIYRNFHMHSDYELIHILDGHATITCRNQRILLNAGDSLILNPYDLHEISSGESGITALILQFSKHFCKDYLPVLSHSIFPYESIGQILPSPVYNDCFVKDLHQLTFDYLNNSDYFAFSCIKNLISVLQLLYLYMDVSIVDENAILARKKKTERMNRITTYIDANYTFPIRLQELADMEGLTVTYFSHFFSENFGITFQDYLTTVRLEHALHLAMNENLSIQLLAELSGFSDSKYLIKAFSQKFGCLLNDYLANPHFSHTTTGEEHNKSAHTLQQILSAKEAAIYLSQADSRT